MNSKYFLRFLVFVLLVFKINDCPAQRGLNDSLWHVYNDKSEPDSIRVKAIHKIASNYYSQNFDSCVLFKEKEIQFALKCKLYKHAIEDLNKIGAVFCNKGNYPRAMEYSFKALKIANDLNDKKEISECFSCIGTIYNEQSYFEKAIEYYFKSLKINEEIGEKGPLYQNISGIYFKQSNYDKALEYLLKDLLIVEKADDKSLTAWYYSKIAGIYKIKSDYSNAFKYYLKSIYLSKEIKNTQRLASNYSEISDLYFRQSDFQKSFEFAFKALNIWEEIGLDLPISSCNEAIAEIYKRKRDYTLALQYYVQALNRVKKSASYEYGVGTCYINIGVVYDSLLNYKVAIRYFDSSLKVSEKINNIELKKLSNEKLAYAYMKTGNFKEAYAFHVSYKELSDSIYNIENNHKITEYQTRFEVQKREEELKSISNAAEIKSIKDKSRQQFIIYFAFGVLFVVVIFSSFLYNRFRITSRQKTIIENQKHLVEEKQNEILDSITYAKRLQEAILPPKEFVNNHIPENFIFYQPKDIVAGDFYWAQKIDDYFYIAAADSTGHGVPGAMVSVVCSNALNRSVKEFKETETGKILDKTRKLVIETFEKSESEVKDGMDISLLRIQKLKDGKTEIQWSGAYNPLWYYVNNESAMVKASASTETTTGFFEVKADKRPIGKHEDPTPFTTHSLTVISPTTFYLFSDGYADQFSAADKKLMTRKFKEILASIQNLSLEEQGKELEQLHQKWKGNMEQTDDVLVIGVRVS